MTATTTACERPDKDVYENRAIANAALRRMPRHRKRQGLQVYQCAAGHWHLGRKTRRARVAWRSDP